MPVRLEIRLVDALGNELPLPEGFPSAPYSNVIPRQHEHLRVGGDRYEVADVDWEIDPPGMFAALMTLRLVKR